MVMFLSTDKENSTVQCITVHYSFVRDEESNGRKGRAIFTKSFKK